MIDVNTQKNNKTKTFSVGVEAPQNCRSEESSPSTANVFCAKPQHNSWEIQYVLEVEKNWLELVDMMVIRAYMASGHRDKPSTKLLVNTVSTRGLIIVMTIMLIINMAKGTTDPGVEFSLPK